ncbi:MAG: outer membrane protein assembly factor BamE [Vicinamibacterales bacterium]|jgi:outer membrane protein assembly factor BamE|nr:outer membrane protein assembly factor BamE [Vicinamibacterales bacterium]
MMQPRRFLRHARWSRAAALAVLAAAIGSAGCVYRPDIQQGNLLLQTDVDQVTVGMTRSQVRFLLGTPMVSDPFAPHRWDYVYRKTYGRESRPDTAHFVVRFEGDKVVSIEKLDTIEPPQQARRPSWQFWRKSPEEALAPPPEREAPLPPPPSPDANTPGTG